MQESIKDFTDQLDCVKTRARGVIELINQFPVSDLMDSNELNKLMNSIENEVGEMQIHIECAESIKSDWID